MPTQYTVKGGDTLSKIAKQYNVDLSNITGYRSGNPNLIYPGEVLTLSNVGDSVNADQIAPPQEMDLPSESTPGGAKSMFTGDSVNKQVERYRKQIENRINERKLEVDNRLTELRAKEESTLGEVKQLTTPFREDLERTERERLYINKNFEENQQLVDELDTLLTEGNNLIRQQQEVTGLAAVRNPRVQKTIDDVAARAGVIEAVINARNGQIAVAENLIDRSVNAIVADRQDQLSYYETVLNLNRQDIISLDKKSEKLADAQVSLIERDLSRAEETADYIKELMVNPDTAALMGEAGVSLNDSVDAIKSKLTKATHNRENRNLINEMNADGFVSVVDPSTVPASQLVTMTGANGEKFYFKKSAKGGSGTGGISTDDPIVLAWMRSIQEGDSDMSQVPKEYRNAVQLALNEARGIGDLTFEEYLAGAQETVGQSFGPNMVKDLRRQYDEEVAPFVIESKAYTEEDIEGYVNSVAAGYTDLETEVPEEIRDQVRTQAGSLLE